MCGPICQRREGLRNSGEKLAPIHYIRSEFLERNLLIALCEIIYAMIKCPESFVFHKSFNHIFRKAKVFQLKY